jgi:hypothetical protein
MKRSLFSLIIAAFATFLLGGVMADFAGINPAIGALGLFGLSMLMPQAKGALYTSVSISGLTTALGAYFRKDTSTYVKETLLGMANIKDRMEIMDDVKDEQPLPNLSITDIVRPRKSTTFDPPSNALAFSARILKVRGAKVDLQIIPSDLYNSWLGKMYAKGSNPYDYPFEQMIAEYVQARIQENIRMKALFSGVYNASGTTPAAIMDGIKTLIAAEVTATNITPIATGAITAANVIDKLELTYDGLGEAYKNGETQILVSPTIFDWYNRKYRELYGSNANYEGMKQGYVLLDGTNCWIKREPGLTGSGRVICTTPDNIVYGIDNAADESSIIVEQEKRAINLLMDFKVGVQFKEIHARALAVNDQA